MNADPKRVIAWVLVLTVPVAAVVVLSGLLVFLPPGVLLEIATKHFAAVVGLPFAALLSAFIVVALHHAAGPLKFEGLGFKFEGGAGEVILWVVCFLAIAGAIRLLWSVD